MSKIRLGPAGIPLGCIGGTLEGVRYAAGEGLSAFEVEFVRGVRMGTEAATKVGEAARERDVLLSCHCPYWINCCAKDPKKIEIAKRNLLETARVAHAMGAWIAVFHPGYYMGRSPEEAGKLVKQTLTDVLGQMRAEGIGDVWLGAETAGKVSQYGTLDEVIGLSAIPGVMPVVDFAHIHARGGGSLKGRKEYTVILDRLEEVGGPLGAGKRGWHCHFSGIEFTDKGERKHLPIESESPPFKPLAEELADRNIAITIISESPLLDMDALRMREIIASIG